MTATPYFAQAAEVKWIWKERAYKRNKALFSLQQCSSDPDKPSSRPILLLAKEWWDFIRALLGNDDDLFSIYAGERVGPTKGWKRKFVRAEHQVWKGKGGKRKLVTKKMWVLARVALKQVGVIWRGRNIVKVIEERADKNGRDIWCKIEALHHVPDVKTVNEIDTPHLVHHIYSVNQRDEPVDANERRAKLVAPIVDEGTELLVRKSELRMITFPRNITARQDVEVRVAPGTRAQVCDVIRKGASVNITRLEVGQGGLWGLVEGIPPRWVPIRMNGENPFENADF